MNLFDNMYKKVFQAENKIKNSLISSIIDNGEVLFWNEEDEFYTLCVINLNGTMYRIEAFICYDEDCNINYTSCLNVHRAFWVNNELKWKFEFNLGDHTMLDSYVKWIWSDDNKKKKEL